MGRQNKAVVEKRAGGEADRHRPCSKQPADEVAGTGLVANSRQMNDRHRPCSKQPADEVAGTGLEANSQQTIRPAQAFQQQPADEVGQPFALKWRLVEGVRWCWHSRGGLRPTYLSPSHLSPLPVTVHTHPLNFEKANLAPTYFSLLFLFFLSLLLPTRTRPLTPFIVCVRLTYGVTLPTPNPYIPFTEGNKGGLASCVEAQRSLRMASS